MTMRSEGMRVVVLIVVASTAAEAQVPTCDPTVSQTSSPRLGFGFDYASGWQHSARPVDGRAWSIGLEARARLRDRWGLVVRVDRSTGRDEARDANRDGRDDDETGDVTRWIALAGPTFILHTHRAPDAARYWQVDALAGVSGRDPAAALDVSYQFVVARIGVRAMQRFGDASHERAAVLHAGFVLGAGPEYAIPGGCGQGDPPGSAWAIALDLPLSGVAQHGGYITPGFGLEGAWHLHPSLDALVRADLFVMPNGDADRALHQSVLAGGRLDLSHAGHPRMGWFATLAGGYDQVATTTSAAIRSGPVVDASLGWGAQGSDGAAYVRVHGRFGVAPDNSDLRAVFVSGGIELRLDRNRWRDRN